MDRGVTISGVWPSSTKRMNQDKASQGWEGRLAPARVEFDPRSGGKPPFLTQSFSIRSLYSLLIVSFVVSLLSVSCAPNQGSRSLPPEVESAIGTINDEIVAERYDKIYSDASELWRQDATLEQSAATFKALRNKLGVVENRTLQSATEQQNSGGPLKGRAFNVSYRTKFQNGEAMETFTLVERDGRWQLARYFVNSTALK